ncbi:SDR family oxidoreductase [Acetivibrio cellulolyticus]|uniref:SDR family oxidoreductase n=1 Tax=Acetivibrio cellulolyticus TaxID=35830 RepID=UPI0001E2FB3E|nr:NAD(P)-dependent oxidoreductase [Acetivibrio cellulolyticus]
MKSILLLGERGKVGTALNSELAKSYNIIGKNSENFNVADFEGVTSLIDNYKPDIVINTVAAQGIDDCERNPERSLRINSLYPKLLAELSNKFEFLLVNFSTECVFKDNEPGNFFIEADRPCPLNVYGLTKYGGDCFVSNIAHRHYIFRLPILFGPSNKNNQFVERMLDKALNQGEKLKVSCDVITSPSYSIDIAKAVKEIIENEMPYGLYHLSNQGAASIYDLMKEIFSNLEVEVELEKVSHKSFQSIGIKNTNTPLKSSKIKSLRPWQEAVADYCKYIKDNF